MKECGSSVSSDHVWIIGWLNSVFHQHSYPIISPTDRSVLVEHIEYWVLCIPSMYIRCEWWLSNICSYHKSMAIMCTIIHVSLCIQAFILPWRRLSSSSFSPSSPASTLLQVGWIVEVSELSMLIFSSPFIVSVTPPFPPCHISSFSVLLAIPSPFIVSVTPPCHISSFV